MSRISRQMLLILIKVLPKGLEKPYSLFLEHSFTLIELSLLIPLYKITFGFTFGFLFFYREKENPPNPFPNSSPWCHSPSVPAHPYSPLTETCTTHMARSSLNRQPRPQSSRPDPAQVSQRDTYSSGELRDVWVWGGRARE